VTQSEARAWEVMGPCRATSMSWPCRKCAGSGRWPTGDRDRDRSVGSDHAARAVPRAGRIEAGQVQNTRRRDPRALRPRAAGGGRPGRSRGRNDPAWPWWPSARTPQGQQGAILRREGLYSSHIIEWLVLRGERPPRRTRRRVRLARRRGLLSRSWAPGLLLRWCGHVQQDLRCPLDQRPHTHSGCLTSV
jgi:hypothetical protein